MIHYSKSIILGPPGTGKTTDLMNTCQILLGEGFNPRDIAFIAFTRKAANEARSRAQVKFNLTPEDLIWFRTLHSMAFTQCGLQRSQILGIRDYWKLAEMLGITITSKGISEDGTLTGLSKGDRLFFMENMARARSIPLKQYWEENPNEDIYWHELERVHETLKSYKESQGKMDFTDIVYKFIEEKAAPSLRVLIVDEAQDLSPIQWKMIDCLTQNSGIEELYIAGDDDQAIFRWAGADVEYFINYGANKRVLEQSYRIPSKIQEVANRIITQVNVRIPKDWKPRPEEGAVHYVTDVDQIDMSQGTWLLLGRNSYLLEAYNQYCMQMGYLFDSSIGSPISNGVVQTIRNWEALRKGKQITVEKVKDIYELMTVKVGVAYGFKTRLEKESANRLVGIPELRAEFGLLTDDIWHKALDRLEEQKREYFIAALRRGEKLSDEPRIRINTIHGVKGGEADNVVLFTDMADRTFREFHENPDDEHRVWYVAVTRAKQSLYIIEPRTDRSYNI